MGYHADRAYDDAVAEEYKRNFLEQECWDSYKKGQLIWTTKVGQEVKIQDMTDAHLSNCISFCKRKDIKNNFIIDILEAEQKKRKYSSSTEIKICNICGKVDVSQQHLNHCTDNGVLIRGSNASGSLRLQPKRFSTQWKSISETKAARRLNYYRYLSHSWHTNSNRVGESSLMYLDDLVDGKEK